MGHINKHRCQWDSSIIDEIRYLRQTYPNLGKDKIHPLLKDFCTKHKLPHPYLALAESSLMIKTR